MKTRLGARVAASLNAREIAPRGAQLARAGRVSPTFISAIVVRRSASIDYARFRRKQRKEKERRGDEKDRREVGSTGDRCCRCFVHCRARPKGGNNARRVASTPPSPALSRSSIPLLRVLSERRTPRGALLNTECPS